MKVNDVSSHQDGNFRQLEHLRKHGFFIVYIDETWFWEGIANDKDWLPPRALMDHPERLRREYGTVGPTPPKSKGRRAIIIGAVSEEGLIHGATKIFKSGKNEDGDYHSAMNAPLFHDWLEKSLPAIREAAQGRPTAIVMDNAPYHSKMEGRPPTGPAYNIGQKIAFLEMHGVPIPPPKSNRKKPDKTQLNALVVKLVEENPHLRPRSVVQEICDQNDIKVVRLPPYHSSLNCIEFVWGNVKKNMRDRCTPATKIKEVERIAEEVLQNISPAFIRNTFEHVRKEEDKYREMDGGGVREPVQNFIIPLENEESDSGDELTDDSGSDLEEEQEEEESEGSLSDDDDF
jgi:transposase